MAAASGRPDRVYHQDYIARIRYSNTLPPPPTPPKLLDIPNVGLASGQYTSPAFASKLAREQPLNIEADAELGMPIDLVGVPGVFDGNETAIYALDNPPPPHPNDRLLLRPLSMLGKTSSMTSGVSFLRRTEYISSDQNLGKVESTKARELRLKQDLKKRKRPELERDNDPVRIIRGINRGFDIAYPSDAADGGASLKGANPEIQAWEHPRHPTNPELKVVDMYPMLPDLDAFPDTGFYLLTKFITNPSSNENAYDPRLDVGLLRPLDPGAEVLAAIEAQRHAHEVDPTQPPPQSVLYNYEYFLPDDANSSENIKTKFDMNSSHKDDASLYTDENKENGKRCFRYSRQRAYETYQQTGDPDDFYGDAVALALHDGGTEARPSRLQKAAYFYPIYQRTYIRPRRQANIGTMGMPMATQGEENKIDQLEIVIRDATEWETKKRLEHKESALWVPVAQET